MILEYFRPTTLDEAIQLLSREQPITRPLGGGTVLTRPVDEPYDVVDLQSLGLSSIDQQGNSLIIGSTVTLQQMVEDQSIPPALRQAAHHEVSLNLRNMGTVAGTLVSADGRSTFTTAMMALDARVKWLPGEVETGIGDWLPLRKEGLPGKLILNISIPAQIKMAFEYVARTPADWPIVCAAVCAWPSGRTRAVLGGYRSAPIMVMDGAGSVGADLAAKSAYSQAGDSWASAEYRAETAAILVRRCLQSLEAK
jgi:CO/xanthine dehydrogenase FAD-binding subunit